MVKVPFLSNHAQNIEQHLFRLEGRKKEEFLVKIKSICHAEKQRERERSSTPPIAASVVRAGPEARSSWENHLAIGSPCAAFQGHKWSSWDSNLHPHGIRAPQGAGGVSLCGTKVTFLDLELLKGSPLQKASSSASS